MKDKIVLISGGTGSFGSTFVRKLLKENAIGEIRIFSRDEKKQDDLRRDLSSSKVKFYIGDVRNIASLNQAMKGVDFVFHAAALKQVPSCEFFPMEAVNTNILGTSNVIDSAVSNQVRRVVCLSTDKAVHPVNAMGMSKALMEKVVQSRARSLSAKSDTILAITRYGNVLGSRGSVVPLFADAISQNKPLTVTDPNMTRFLMTLEDSVNLVDHAFRYAQQGDIFVQKSPAATIGELAEAVKVLFQSEVPIVKIGVRHGEKMYETLASAQELSRGDERGEYFRIAMDNRDLNYANFFEQGNEHLTGIEDYSSDTVQRLGVSQLVALLRTVIQRQR